MPQGFESPIEIEIVYHLPTYASDASSRLAHELIEDISDFLWDEPVQLARCCLVCRAWYHAARRHLTPWLTIRSNNALRDLVHILMSKRNGKYGQVLQHLTINDDAQRAFAHTLSVRIPGCLLPSLRSLQFSYLDWTAALRPHASFFTFLTYFQSVTALVLEACHFHSTDDFHRIVDALPRLQTLTLDTVTISSKQREGIQAGPPRRFSRSKLTDLYILGFQISDHPSDPATHSDLYLQQNHTFLGALSSYSTVVSLQLTMHNVSSFSQLQHFMRNFPALREVWLHYNPAWNLPKASTETSLLRTDLSIDAWPTLGLSMMSSAVTLRFLELFTTQYCKVQNLFIDVRDLRSSALLQVVEEVLRSSGSALNVFSWFSTSGRNHIVEDSERQIAPDPIPRLTYNINLETFYVDIFVPTVPSAYTSLMTLLLHIESTRLRMLQISLTLRCPPLADMDLPMEGSVGSIAAFHAMLRRPVFDGLPAGAMRIYINFRDDNIEPFAEDVASAKIKTIMVPLFAPWLARGVLALYLPDRSVVEDVPPEIGPAAPPIDEDSSAGDGALRGLAG
ncbi:hypothetical protein DAEQUDRAFT_812403 [Daedalea quercina L-15889]|uniref:F-box domain-containing protein n=1 Tax=Daedalea quercina L-15889 TaxID=1314783 RepID=A0A165PD81_9APHY|nr:hypothetical protein DAEQUDRAFT_812403 [Daedalea quercina L-15889]